MHSITYGKKKKKARIRGKSRTIRPNLPLCRKRKPAARGRQSRRARLVELGGRSLQAEPEDEGVEESRGRDEDNKRVVYGKDALRVAHGPELRRAGDIGGARVLTVRGNGEAR